MVKIEAIIKPFKLEEVKEGLTEIVNRGDDRDRRQGVRTPEGAHRTVSRSGIRRRPGTEAEGGSRGSVGHGRSSRGSYSKSSQDGKNRRWKGVRHHRPGRLPRPHRGGREKAPCSPSRPSHVHVTKQKTHSNELRSGETEMLKKTEYTDAGPSDCRSTDPIPLTFSGPRMRPPRWKATKRPLKPCRPTRTTSGPWWPQPWYFSCKPGSPWSSPGSLAQRTPSTS